MYRQRESAKGNHKQPATGKNEVQRHFRRTIPTDREGGKKDKVLCDRLLLSARERAMDIIGYNPCELIFFKAKQKHLLQ